ncbi:Uncharacterized protein PHSC3_000818 [Chlamydiales bacterium STE3]|nr:Uncharacterized protein PHSC3_000818 [Chlamydiales bacterium STE3]
MNSIDSGLSSTNPGTPVTKEQSEKKADKTLIEKAIEGVKEHSSSLQGTIPPVPTSTNQAKIEETLQSLPSHVRESISIASIEKIDWEELASLPEEDQAFVHFANSMMINGIICRERANQLGLLQVSSLDKNLRPEKEVEVNAYKSSQGITKSLFDPAKGAISILLERKNDSPNVDYAPLTPEQEAKLSSMGPLAAVMRSSILKNSPLMLKGEPQEIHEIIEELSKRAHAGILIIIDPNDLELKNNEDQKIEDVKGSLNHSWIERSLPDQPCLEVKINANIAASSFSLILLPKHYKPYKKFFVLQEPIKFVDSVESEITYNFPPPEPMRDRTNTSVKVPLLHPNFEKEAQEYLQEMQKTTHPSYIIQHVGKGPRPNDPMFTDYWSQVSPEHYKEWLSK